MNVVSDQKREAGGREHHKTTDTAISVHNLSKMYPLYRDPRDRLRQSLWYALPKFLRGAGVAPEFFDEFWALRDVSFDIKQGETVGVIGRNGSGKSTLLQILAGTLASSAGMVEVNGRVAALLELGSGFNWDFTGRENVYLNGAILGLPQSQIDDLFDDIASFADIGQFIDQPVKLYSSGMVVRLAFAVQAFVPKQILIVDEALSVGDEAFQRKCMAVLDRFKQEGGTVLLVSHDAQTIVRQCDRCLLFHQGSLVADGSSKPVTDLYQKLLYSPPSNTQEILSILQLDGLQKALSYSFSVKTASTNNAVFRQNSAPLVPNVSPAEQLSPIDSLSDWFDPHMPVPDEITYGNNHAQIIDCKMVNDAGEAVNVLVTGRRYQWVYQVRFHEDANEVNFGMMLKTKDGLDIAGVASNRENTYFEHIPANTVMRISFSLQMNVTPGIYFLNAGIDGRIDNELIYLHRRVDVAVIRVIPCDTRSPYGIAYLHPEFKFKYLTDENPEP